MPPPCSTSQGADLCGHQGALLPSGFQLLAARGEHREETEVSWEVRVLILLAPSLQALPSLTMFPHVEITFPSREPSFQYTHRLTSPLQADDSALPVQGLDTTLPIVVSGYPAHTFGLSVFIQLFSNQPCHLFPDTLVETSGMYH